MTMPCEGDLIGKVSRIGKGRSYAMPMTQADDESLDSLPKRDAAFIEPIGMSCDKHFTRRAAMALGDEA